MSAPPTVLVFDTIELRLAERQLLVDGEPVALGSRGFDLLKALVAKRDRVVGKDELLDEVWPGLVVEENNLQVQISGLRRVLGARAIATVSGIGYRFTLTPGVAGGAAPAVPPASVGQAGPALAAARVLVADDNRVNRLLLCRSLELMGHRVCSAENGRQALDLLRAQPYELLLLDLAMPELDGFGVLQARAADPALREVAVIVTSALGGVAPVARCIELGADDFLHKPVDPWLLRARVDSSLARKQQRDQQSLALRHLMPGGPAQASRLADACVLVVGLNVPDLMSQAPALTQQLLSNWSTLMLDVVAGCGGEVAQYCGNGLMALFAEPQAALRAAHDMAEVVASFNEERRAAGHLAIEIGVGIARGEVVVATVATAQRAAYACLGEAALRAQQLAAACLLGGQEMLLDAGFPTIGD